MVAFILVHGTFVKSAEWPALECSLREVAKSIRQNAHIEQVPWTGKNRASAREGAASEIADKVREARSKYPDRKIFLIGHSHGGSAIAYFLKNKLEEAANVDGCAFLSTPFVAIRRRNDASQILGALTFFVVFSSAAFLASFPTTVRYLSLLAMTVVVLLGAVVFAISRRSTEHIIQQQTANLPDGRYLFLRCSGDEAAAALSVAQFVAWLGAKASAFLARQIRPLFSSRVGTTVAIAYLAFCVIAVAFGAIDMTSTGSDLTKTSVGTGIARVFRETFASGYTFSSFIIATLFVGGVSLAVFINVAALVAVSVFLLQALTTWAFGWTGFFTGFLVELAIEPLPFGTHSLTHIDWSEGSGLHGMVHSWTWEHPVAIEHLQNWIRSAL